MSIVLLAAFLAGQSATATPPPAAPPTSNRDKVRCKREVETGSLVKARKVCHTNAEWDALQRESREAGQQLQDGFRPAGPT